MSIDDQLRAAYGTVDDSWQESVETTLSEVTRRHRRAVALRRAALAGGVAAAVATGAVLLGGGPFTSDTAPDPLSPPSPPAVGEDPSLGVTALQGRWRTAPLDEAALRQSMATAGDDAFGDDVIAALPPAPFRLVWEVDRGTGQLRAVAAGEETVLDEVSVAVEDDTVTMTPRFAEGSTEHRFDVVGDELRLAFVSTTEPPLDGIPGGVWQRLLYDTAAFTRG